MFPGPAEVGSKVLDPEIGPGSQSWRKTGLAGARSRGFAPVAGVGRVHLRVTGWEEVLGEAAGRNCQCRCTAAAAGSGQSEIGSQEVRRFDYRLLVRADKMEQVAGDVVDTAAAAGYQGPGREVVGSSAHHQIDRADKMERMMAVVVGAAAAVSQTPAL